MTGGRYSPSNGYDNGYECKSATDCGGYPLGSKTSIDGSTLTTGTSSVMRDATEKVDALKESLTAWKADEAVVEKKPKVEQTTGLFIKTEKDGVSKTSCAEANIQIENRENNKYGAV